MSDRLRREAGRVITGEQVDAFANEVQAARMRWPKVFRVLDAAAAWQECDAEARKETIEDLRDLLERMEYGVEHGEGGAPAACRPHRDALRAALALLGDDAAKDAG